MKHVLSIFYVLIFSISTFAVKDKNLTLLNWWDYTSEKTIKTLASRHVKLNIVPYRSNDVAISNLINKRNEINFAIISNVALKEILDSKFILKNSFYDKILSKKYYPFTRTHISDCLPYLWSTSVFITNVKEEYSIASFSDFERYLPNFKYSGILDDKLELISRLIGDNPDLCSSGPGYLNCGLEKITKLKLSIPKNGFISSFYEILKFDNSIAYGWHGIAGPLIDKEKNLKFYVPKLKPVVGYDSICLIDNPYTRAHKDELVKIAEEIVSQESIHHFVKEQQYFSPIVGDEKFLKPKMKDLLHQILSKIKSEGVIFIKTPEPEAHKMINEWWQKLRYGK